MKLEATLLATLRPEKGKGPAGRLRKEGLIPAVFYGTNKPSQPITVNYKELKKVVFSGTSARSIFKLRVGDGDKGDEVAVMLKDYQLDPIKRTVVHADFYEVDLTKPLEIEVPVVLTGKPIGVEAGGMLQQIRRELLVSALLLDLPEEIEIDVSQLDIGDSIHVEEVAVPDGVTFIYDVNFTVATVSSPRVQEEEAEAEEGEELEGEEAAEAASEDGESKAEDESE
jgi:large subunit ribosomal protein L25